MTLATTNTTAAPARNDDSAARAALGLVERGLVPDALLRIGIRRLLAARLVEVHADDPAAAAVLETAFVAAMRASPLALLPEKANEQHYEVPAAFYEQVLGRQRKYSCCWWPDGVATLDDAEAAALAMTCERAGIEDGQRILELGCGWGSLTLWIAERYPRCHVSAVSNSQSQRAHIEAQARARGLANVDVVTCDINDYDTPARHDRVVSVEMFEHLRNWELAFARVAGWLAPGGRFFLHVFAHRGAPYAFEARDASDWMSTHFFSGGMMPGDDLPLRFQRELAFVERWRWDGTHYERTARAWLANMDARRAAVLPVLQATYGADAARWWVRWRLFFLAVAELFGHDRGRTWWVGHYLLQKR